MDAGGSLPPLNSDKINKSLFVIQGANDPWVNINKSDQIVRNLRKRGFDVPYMVKYNEGHGFVHEENNIELYKTMLGFFCKVFEKLKFLQLTFSLKVRIFQSNSTLRVELLYLQIL